MNRRSTPTIPITTDILTATICTLPVSPDTFCNQGNNRKQFYDAIKILL
ncbi:hypothetical protein ACFSTE_07460 [Aquimarina hainanensis]|uniref:Uncharacterized protein n=1 Tax=Aquimarina hainanensis TaxID=1578017 RepID=A0ABW5N601_9FLAO|nr:hypothetical protein [Aquimarina sp. TRL1]QKX05082.1 hypothetical protein HN014_09175 [Aquimarina sp. TRL1]